MRKINLSNKTASHVACFAYPANPGTVRLTFSMNVPLQAKSFQFRTELIFVQINIQHVTLVLSRV